MTIDFTLIKNIIFMTICACLVGRSLIFYIKKKPAIFSEKTAIWLFLPVVALYFSDSFDSGLMKEPELLYALLWLGVYLLAAVVIVGILVSLGKVSYGYTITGIDIERLSQAISDILTGLNIEHTWSPPKFNLITVNSVLEVTYSGWWRSARLSIRGASNQKFLNEIVRSLKQEKNSLLEFNKRAVLIELSIGILGLAFFLARVILKR